MPRIILKHKSPEYDLPEKRQDVRVCDMPGCPSHGEHKAPKHRGLNEYYMFCFDHIREYNSAWDFFSGMSEREVQNHMENSVYGDRPTWRYAGETGATEHLKRSAEKLYNYEDEFTSSKNNRPHLNNNTPEFEAMAIMGLEPPLSIDSIKARYKILAKKYHPDLNRDNPEAEELLKRINMAYTLLKLAFEDYKKLPDHKF